MSVQAAPVATKATRAECDASPLLERVAQRCGWVGTATIGVTNGAIGDRVTAFRTEVVLTAAMAPGRTIRPHIGAVLLPDHGVGDP